MGLKSFSKKLKFSKPACARLKVTLSRVTGGGLAIPPGEKVVLAPGAYKLALLKLKSALKKGTKVSMTLEFEKAGKVTVPFEVLGAAAKGPVAPRASADDGKMKK